MVLLQVIFADSLFDWQPSLIGVALNGFLSGILALGLLTPLENLLNTASIFRLMDLSDLNSPLLRRFMLAAPGTYNHSVMVATLAENACAEIGANALLARVGAYYHDIGKMEQPEYFVENQTGNNKHHEINPRLSVAVIKSHVKKGIEKCRQLRLPEEVIDIVAEHHGNGLISFFYAAAKKLDDSVTPEEFSYSGNPPSSREAAVVMLADVSEAACRTLDKPTAQRLDKFIHQLIMDKVENHLLDHCNLTFRDLGTIKDSFVRILAGYYHNRIEYPDQKEVEADEGESA
jgi:putative nucleotidyltransferase with HDIG domain